jgi:integrase/recombinase XerD
MSPRTDPKGCRANNRLGAKPMEAWLPANQDFYTAFRRWLRAGGYADSALDLYSVAARLALGWLDKAYWLIDPETDLEQVRAAIAARYERESTRQAYCKGLAKLGEYLRLRCGRPAPEEAVHWDRFVGPLPAWLAAGVREYVAHRSRGWLPEVRYRTSHSVLSRLTLSLRWMAAHSSLASLEDLTPALWFDYLDGRLASGVQPVTTNGELRELQRFVRFVAAQDRPVCRRMLLVEPLKAGPRLPRDVPVEQLRRLLAEIETEAAAQHAGVRRMGLLDRAWFLLMLHSGLRTGEVRRLKQGDLDLEARRLRIEQSKGLKDRLVYLSAATVEAVAAYQAVRGPAGTDQLSLYRHLPLTGTYCSQRLKTYGTRCGVRVTPHQLRHSCATLLLNAGAPVVTVQMLLGHKNVDTTLAYARLYDGTVAADYYRAMAEIESRYLAPGDPAPGPPTCGELLALVDALRDGTLNDGQRETLHALRAGILSTFGPREGSLVEAEGNSKPEAA